MFLGIRDDSGEFAPYGTGFIVFWEEQELRFGYLVTAQHVLNDIRKTKRALVGRLNLRKGGADIGTIGDEHWFTHPTNLKCDVAVSGINVSATTFDICGIDLDDATLTESYISQNDIGCGDEVFMAGLLVSHFGKTKNVPVVRTGTIAAMPEERVDLGLKLGEQEAYLIESRSIGGLSGSPVFLHTPTFRIINAATVDMKGHKSEYLMGVNIGLFETKAHGDKLPTDIVGDNDDRRARFLEAMSAGIAIVIPIERAIEIIRDSPGMKKGREDAMKIREQKIGFKPTSASPAIYASDDLESSPPATDENPNHLEDFNRLVDVAARKRPRDD